MIGALELSRPGDGILPHEHTTPKAKSDRLDLMRATGRQAVAGVGALADPGPERAARARPGAALADWTDEDGVSHTVWRVDDPERVAAIAAAVGRHAGGRGRRPPPLRDRRCPP